MIDRTARNDLAALIRSYLSEQLTAFEFDEALDEFRVSGDDAVMYVADAVWYHYDDCEDHLVVLTKPEWNYFQRLLLLLESNSTVRFTKTRYWNCSQIIAVVLLLCCGLIAAQTGIGAHLYLYFIPLGIGSIILSFLRRPSGECGPYAAIVFPFSSIQDLRIAYDNAQFHKVRYPKHLSDRSLRSPFMNWFWVVHNYVCWSICAPIPLLAQCFPVTNSEVSIDPS
ncbi:hypothetical protein [Bythopirellula goksoeyrii]|uniref:Uncharacterized protein n=1 Tax=Bythopirellula goksoeyrii TaxID=1400387 RepID=A0A5B9QUN1_9BACT|nr:hypothetical protein [Bythopirellula goksoeyrii]QEG37623.1 hypothetical protein Pr1d_49690 [Bythopirellula goksoeyrii]